MESTRTRVTCAGPKRSWHWAAPNLMGCSRWLHSSPIPPCKPSPPRRWRGPRFGMILLLLTSGPGAKIGIPCMSGARACALCHEGAAMGNQTSKWLLSKHAKAYAAWQCPRPADRPPQRDPAGAPRRRMCLGCHATGSEAEDWEKDETFSFKDGVQCEKCHGAGSEYMDAKVMTNQRGGDPQGPERHGQGATASSATRRRTRTTRSSSSRHWTWKKRGAEIAHPTPEDWDPTSLQPPKPPVGEKALPSTPARSPAASATASPRWASSSAAGGQQARRGLRRAGHAQAQECRREVGRSGATRRTTLACLKCHATAYHQPPAGSSG